MGPPGERTFFLQGRAGDRLVTVLVEKQQVQLLAASIVEILARIGKPTGDGPPEEEMGLEEPVLPLHPGGEENRGTLGGLDVHDGVSGQVQDVVTAEIGRLEEMLARGGSEPRLRERSAVSRLLLGRRRRAGAGGRPRGWS